MALPFSYYYFLYGTALTIRVERVDQRKDYTSIASPHGDACSLWTASRKREAAHDESSMCVACR